MIFLSNGNRGQNPFPAKLEAFSLKDFVSNNILRRNEFTVMSTNIIKTL